MPSKFIPKKENPNSKPGPGAAANIEQKEIKKFVDDAVKTIPIQELQEFLFNNLTAAGYQMFTQGYNGFLQQKYVATKAKK